MRRNPSDTAQVLTVTDLCSYLKVSRGIVYRLIRARGLPAFEVAYHWRANRDEIERWRAERETKPDA
jgi:excisionase family DNA binding protein